MRWGRLLVENHRGVPVPRVLGIALAIDAVVWTLVVATITDVGVAGWGALGGLLLVFGAGLIDDLAPQGPRGLRDHLRSVASGRVTTGLIKVVVIAGSDRRMCGCWPTATSAPPRRTWPRCSRW